MFNWDDPLADVNPAEQDAIANMPSNFVDAEAPTLNDPMAPDITSIRWSAISS